MPRKKNSKEELLEKAKTRRKLRYAKIKADPSLYALEKEKERQRYIKRKEQKKILSIQEMTPRAKRQQRKKWRQNFQNHYHKKLLQKRGVDLMDANTPSCSDGEDLPIQNENPPVIDHEAEHWPANLNNCNSDMDPNPPDAVPTQNNDEGSNIVKKLKKRLKQLSYASLKKDKLYKFKIEHLQKKVNNYKKIITRLKKKIQSPNTRADELLRDNTKKREAKKKILFGEAMKKSLEVSYTGLQSKKDKKKFSETVLQQKNILKDNKVLSETQSFTVRDKKETIRKQNHFEKLKEDIRKFFERDDVSRMTAGKKECITREKVKKQRRYLIDTMKNLHKSFEQEFSKISYSYFCKQRPFWVLIPDVDDRETCLCKTHANIDLLIQALNKRKILKEKDSKDIVNSLCCSNPECLMKRCDACKFKNLEYVLEDDEAITFGKWENRIEKYVSKTMEKEKRIIAKTQKTISPQEAVTELEITIPEFLKHEGTRRWQFSAIKELKAHLKDNEAIIHVDFSENYAFKYESEVQAFHFGGSREELTLHTAVIYYIGDIGELKCKSFCTVSKNMRHDAAAVWAHIIPLLEYVQSTSKNIDTLHFLSDSPSSQYRNKTMFYIISKLHWHFHSLKLVTWNYSEAGHGKGAADGVGGTVKRIADSAVAKGKDIVTIDSFIQTVAQSTKNIILETIDDYQIFEKDLLIAPEKLKVLKGTLKVHQILWQKGNTDLLFREASCFECLDISCKHTNFVGKLNFTEKVEKSNDTPRNSEKKTVAFPHKVQPKNMVFGKFKNKTLRAKYYSPAGKENIKITSNVVVKSPQKETERLIRLSGLTTDNNMHLEPDVNIDDMLNMYDISTTSENFSGILEDRPPQSLVSRCSNDFSGSDIDLIIQSPHSIQSRKSFNQVVMHTKEFKRDTDNNLQMNSPESFKMSPTKHGAGQKASSSHSSLPLRKRQLRFETLSSEDDEFEIFPRKKEFFK